MLKPNEQNNSEADNPLLLRLPFPWQQGEHMTIIGDTGTGKTRLAARLITHFPYSVSVRSKADNIKLPGKLIRKAEAIDDIRYDRFVLHPPYEYQQVEFARLMSKAFQQGGWLVFIDELLGVSRLGLTPLVEKLLTQGRSLGLTLVTGLQTPVNVTRYAISQATHVLTFREEGRYVKTIAEATSPAIRDAIDGLERFQFLWFYRPTREYWIGRLQDL